MAGVTPFNMDDEYEGAGFTEDGEFYFDRQRSKRRMTKEDQIYGVFAEDEDEGDAERGHAAGLRGGRRRATDDRMHMPIAFTKAKDSAAERSHHDDGDSDEEQEQEDDDDASRGSPRGDDDGGDDDASTARAGLGGGTSMSAAQRALGAALGQQLGQRKSAAQAQAQQRRYGAGGLGAPAVAAASSSARPYGSEVLGDDGTDARPSLGLGARAGAGAGAGRAAATQQRTRTAGLGARAPPRPAALASSVTDTRYGIGSKLLRKMGYVEGTGLGKDGKGIVEPVSVTVRAKRTALTGEVSAEEERRMREQAEEEKRMQAEAERLEQLRAAEAENRGRWKRGQERGGMRSAEAMLAELESQQRSSQTMKPAARRVAEAVARAQQQQQQQQHEDGVGASAGSVRFALPSDEPAAAFVHASSDAMVIDMTGQQARTFTSVQQASFHQRQLESGAVAISTASERLQALQFNVKLLCDASRAAAERTVSSKTLLESKLVNVERDEADLQAELERAESLLLMSERAEALVTELLESVSSAVTRKTADANADALLATVEQAFRQLRVQCAPVYDTARLGRLAAGIVFPLLERRLRTWEPLADPAVGVREVMRWKDFLDQSDAGGAAARGDAAAAAAEAGAIIVHETYFERLVADVLLTPIQRAFTNEWNAREPETALAAVSLWLRHVPRSAFVPFLETVVVAKVRDALEAWLPQSDPVPVHRWVLPWYRVLPADLYEPLLVLVRQKLGLVLDQHWHPSDASAYAMVQPWRDAFGADALQQFLDRHVTPKLRLVLAQLAVNPAQQQLGPVQWALAWEPLMSPAVLARVFADTLLPKFSAVLQQWLTGAPNYDEVSRWYLGWRQLFPERLAREPLIVQHFELALNMMNTAAGASSSADAAARLAELNQHVRESRAELERRARTARVVSHLRAESERAAATSSAAQNESASVREVLEHLADENGLLFVATTKRRHPAGLPVYQLGTAFVAIEKDVVRMLVNGEWELTSIGELMARAGAAA